MTVEKLSLLFCIQELMVSNIVLEMSYPDWFMIFCCYSRQIIE
jgi:hypothetical protein